MTATNGEKGHRKLKKNRLRLCDLPDEILIAILSLLPTESAIATGILSKRWRYLWTSVSNLSFYAYAFDGRRSEFIDFVDTTMILHDRSCLASYSLACNIQSDAPRINVWITSAVRSNIQHLSLRLNRFESLSYMLPRCLFSCQSLVKLQLTMYNQILRVPSSVWLPNLKHLELSFVRFDDDESTEKLLSHPSLEELHIWSSDWAEIESVTVSVPKLRVLVIIEDSVYYEQDGDGNEDTNFVVDFSNDRKVQFLGNNLEYFRFTGCPINEYCICGSAMQLKKAEIMVQYASPSKVDMDVVAKRCYKLLSGLSWVQDLTLTEDFLEDLEQIPELVDTIPMFERLTRLNLVASEDVCIDRVMLMKIYERCPNLEHLHIKQVVSGLVRGPILHPTPSCFRTHLKRITVTNYLSGDQDNAIDVLLNSALVLEEMIICYREHDCYDEDEIEELEVELNERPRVSRDCRISVVCRNSEFEDFL